MSALNILQEINSLWLSIAALSTLFLFYLLKVKFQKKASLKTYGILFYAFVFYCISVFSFVVLNGLNQFFHIENDLYSGFIWFFPIAIISGFMGALVGWIIYFSATKMAKDYSFQLMNYSLIIIAPYLVYTLLVKPFYETITMYLPAKSEAPISKEINVNQIESLDNIPSTEEDWIEAVPAQLFDSLLVQTEGKNIRIMNNRNGFTYSVLSSVQPIHQVYVSSISNYKQLALLALAPAIQQQAAFIIIDSLGMKIFEKKIEHNGNRLFISSSNKYAKIMNDNSADSLVFKEGFRLKP